MTRISKQSERRATSPRKCRKPSPKTGTKKNNLPLGYKEHPNALQGEANIFIPKVK